MQEQEVVSDIRLTKKVKIDDKNKIDSQDIDMFLAVGSEIKNKTRRLSESIGEQQLNNQRKFANRSLSDSRVCYQFTAVRNEKDTVFDSIHDIDDFLKIGDLSSSKSVPISFENFINSESNEHDIDYFIKIGDEIQKMKKF